MRHPAITATLSLAIGLVGLVGPASAQYRYPAGYGGFGGWGGGASTVGGNAAMGMGAFAAGAGSYNEQTAQARSINAQTAMQANEYMYQCQQRRNRKYQQEQAERQKNVNMTAQDNYKRIHDTPTPHDIHVGDAENIVLDELLNPKVFTKALDQGGKMSISSTLVKTLPLTYAPQAVTISLEDLQSGAPDELLTNPAFATEVKQFRAVVAKARKEGESQGRIAPETLAQGRTILKALQTKVDATLADGTPARRQVDNYLKALYGLTKMLKEPNIKAFLSGLDKTETTDMAHLLSFMHSFQLRFGIAKTPEQEAAYDAIYPQLLTLRDTVIAGGQGATPFDAPTTPADPSKLTTFFSGMDRSHFDPQPDPHTGQVPPPPPPQ